jgi:hypothetical protein
MYKPTAGVSASAISGSNSGCMAMKTLRFRGVNSTLPWQAVAHKLMTVVAISALLLMVSGCVASFRPTGPALYKPSCDMEPVLKLHLPDPIDTLTGVSKSETIVENGINILTGATHRSYDIRDWFYLRSEAIEYQVIIFYGSAGCMKWYDTEKKRHRVFREVTESGLTGCIHYTEQPRADPEGGLAPMGYYISRAEFRLHNLYIRVVTKARADKGEKAQNDKLTNAVNDLAQMLTKACNGR